MSPKLNCSSKSVLWKPVGAAESCWNSTWEKLIWKHFLIFSHDTCFYFISSQPLHSPSFLSFISLAIFPFHLLLHSSAQQILPIASSSLTLFPSPSPSPSVFLSLPCDYSTALLQKSAEGLACSFWEQSFFFCRWWRPDAGGLIYLEMYHNE